MNFRLAYSLCGAAVLLVVGVARVSGSTKGGSQDEKLVWREKYERLFKQVPRANNQCSADLSLEQTKQYLSSLRNLLKKSTTLRRSLPQWEIMQVEFWADACEFKQSHCSILHDKNIDGKSKPPIMSGKVCGPNLTVLRNHLMQAVQDFCLNTVAKDLVAHLKRIPSSELSLLASMSNGDIFNTKRAAKHLAFYVPRPTRAKSKVDLFLKIKAQTKTAYQIALENPCGRVKGVPLVMQDTVEYFRHKKLLNRVDHRAEQWAAAARACGMLNEYLDLVVDEMPTALIEHYNLTSKDLCPKENIIVKSVRGCFKGDKN